MQGLGLGVRGLGSSEGVKDVAVNRGRWACFC